MLKLTAYNLDDKLIQKAIKAAGAGKESLPFWRSLIRQHLQTHGPVSISDLYAGVVGAVAKLRREVERHDKMLEILQVTARTAGSVNR